ncbi:MAG TPA: hypothetical protein VGM98_12015 [Schlesneria sp.]
MHRLQWAVSHNSYDTPQQEVSAGLPFVVSAFYDAGFRGIELDINRDIDNPSRPEWCVNHGQGFDRKYKLLSSYLIDLQTWSRSYLGKLPHEPLFVHLDCKDFDVDEAFASELDTYLLRYLPNQPIYRPKEVLNRNLDLMQSAMSLGWNSPAMLAGRLLFVLTGAPQPKAQYARSNPSERVCFADLDIDFAFDTTIGTRILANDDAFIDHSGFDFGGWCSEQKGILWRLYYASTDEEFAGFSARGANMVAAATAVALPARGFWLNPSNDPGSHSVA